MYIYVLASVLTILHFFFAMHGQRAKHSLGICKKCTTILWVFFFFGFLLLRRRLPCPETYGDVEIACGQSASCRAQNIPYYKYSLHYIGSASGTGSHKQDFWASTTNTWQAQTKDNFHQHHRDTLCVMSSIYQGITMNWEWPSSWFLYSDVSRVVQSFKKYNSKKSWSASQYSLLQKSTFWTKSLSILGMIPCSLGLNFYFLADWVIPGAPPRSLSSSFSWRSRPESNAIPQSVVGDHDCFHWKVRGTFRRVFSF